MFVAAPVKERCFAASQCGQCWLVGSYIHANRPRRGNKRETSAIHLSKAFFGVILWLRHKRGGDQTWLARFTEVPHKKDTEMQDKAIRSVALGDVYIWYVQVGGFSQVGGCPPAPPHKT